MILIDTAAGLGSSVLWFNTWANHIIVVVTPDPTSLTDAYALIKVLSLNHQRGDFHILANLVRDDREARHTFKTLEKVAHQFLPASLHYLGAVPHDPQVKKAVREQVPFFTSAPRSSATQAVLHLAARLPGSLPKSMAKAPLIAWLKEPSLVPDN